MDFDFTDEQKMLRDGLSRLIAQKYTFEDRQRTVTSKPGWRPDLWSEFAEMGLMMAPLPEEMGGLDGDAIDSMIIMEEFGKGLVIEPYLQSVVCAGSLIKNAGSEAQKSEYGEKIASGESIFAVGLYEAEGRFDPSYVATAAKKNGNDYVLNGQKAVVLGGPMATSFVISARTSGANPDENGISLFVVEKGQEGLTAQDYTTVDGLRASELFLEGVVVTEAAVLGAIGGGFAHIELMRDEAIAALCAEAVGLMSVANAQTIEYAKTRKQFGVPISTFQVLQHAMVNMLIALEEAKSMALLAAIECAGGDAKLRAKACAAAKVKIGQSARIVGQNAIQIHGGMGMTNELAISHYFKRLTMIDAQFGNVDYHLRRYADMD
jgi:alkylation response protein AidB-like acyl-CoA dehydrogenase